MRLKKFIQTAIIAGALAASFASTALAGQWIHDNYGWWYDNGDGTWQCHGWFQDPADGKWYYFDQYGYMMSKCVTPDGYILGEDGSWVPTQSSNGR